MLIAAHSTGILHRDIKPDNVLLHMSSDGEGVKVLDFGISKMLGQDEERPRGNQTREGNLIGTPVYMAPERIRAGAQDGRSDVYSVGVMFDEMATGHLPFFTLADDLMSMLVDQLTKEPRRLRELRPDLPEALETLVMSMLEKDFTKRPDMRTFLSKLLQIADNELGHETRLKLLSAVKSDGVSTRSNGEVVSVRRGPAYLPIAPGAGPVGAFDRTLSEPIPESVRQSVLREEAKH